MASLSNAFRVSTMLIDVSTIVALPGHRLRVRFADGLEGEFDAREMVAANGSMVRPLKDPQYFARVFVEDGAPTWPNGFDIAPDYLYKRMKAAGLLALSRDVA